MPIFAEPRRHDGLVLAGVLLAATWPPATGSHPQQAPPPAPAPPATPPADNVDARVRAIAADLEHEGLAVDLTDLRIEVLPRAAVGARLGGQNEEIFGALYETLWLLQRASGPEHAAAVLTLADYRSAQTAVVPAEQSAWFLAEERTLLLAEEFRAALGTPDVDDLIAHELVHSVQSREGRLLEVFAQAGTIERTLLARCLQEGEADVVAVRRRARHEGLALDRLPKAVDAFRGLPDHALREPTMVLHYWLGLRWMMRAWIQGRHDLAGIAEDAPPSSEQLLHESKVGLDLPVAVGVPELRLPADGAVARDDTVGELGLLLVARSLGVDARRAWQGAIGWDGDTLRSWTFPDGSRAFAWRIAFDRPVDAEQWRACLPADLPGIVVRDALVEWCAADAEERRGELLELCAALPVPAREPTDAVTSKREEEELLAAVAVAQASWSVRKLGIRVAIPDGWHVEAVQGTEILCTMQEDGYADNVQVEAIASPGANALTERGVAKLRAEFEKSLKVHDARLRTLPTGPAAWIDADVPTPQGPVRMQLLMAKNGPLWIRLRAYVLAKRWDRRGADVEAIFTSLQLNDRAPPPPGK